jgi:hypothetical protein
MLRLANQVIDAYDDVGKVGIKKLARANPSVYVMSDAEKTALCDTDFALSVITKKAHKLNKYPVDSPDNTWLSNEYFDMFHNRLPEKAASVAAYNIKQACDRFGIAPKTSVTGLAKEASSNVYFEEDGALQKKASVKTVNLSEFAEAEKIGDNYTFAQYAFSTPGHVKIACQYFDQQHSKMPADGRFKYAAAIQRRAHELGMGPQKGTVAKYASDHYSPQVDAHIRARASLLEVADPRLNAALEKIGSLKKELVPAEFAQLLYAFDKKAKLDRYYDGYLTNPFVATFALEPDQYAGWRAKVAGKTLNPEALAKLVGAKADKIKEYFGSSMLQCLQKDPVAIFDSLPMDAKEIMVGFADDTY